VEIGSPLDIATAGYLTGDPLAMATDGYLVPAVTATTSPLGGTYKPRRKIRRPWAIGAVATPLGLVIETRLGYAPAFGASVVSPLVVEHTPVWVPKPATAEISEGALISPADVGLTLKLGAVTVRATGTAAVDALHAALSAEPVVVSGGATLAAARFAIAATLGDTPAVGGAYVPTDGYAMLARLKAVAAKGIDNMHEDELMLLLLLDGLDI